MAINKVGVFLGDRSGFELISSVELVDYAHRQARRQAQDAANAYGYAWLFRYHDEWAIEASRIAERPMQLTEEAEFFQRKEKAPE